MFSFALCMTVPFLVLNLGPTGISFKLKISSCEGSKSFETAEMVIPSKKLNFECDLQVLLISDNHFCLPSSMRSLLKYSKSSRALSFSFGELEVMLVVVLVVVVLLLLTIGFSGKLGTAGFTGSVSCFVGVEIGVWTFAGEFYVRNIWRFHQCDNQTQFFFFVLFVSLYQHSVSTLSSKSLVPSKRNSLLAVHQALGRKMPCTGVKNPLDHLPLIATFDHRLQSFQQSTRSLFCFDRMCPFVSLRLVSESHLQQKRVVCNIVPPHHKHIVSGRLCWDMPRKCPSWHSISCFLLQFEHYLEQEKLTQFL